MNIQNILGFIEGFYSNHFVDEEGRQRAPIMENVEGRLFIVDRFTSDVLAEFAVDGSLCYAEPDLYEALVADEADAVWGAGSMGSKILVSQEEWKALNTHEFKLWADRGGTRPPLRKVCGPWVQDDSGHHRSRTDYRGKICAVITPRRNQGGYDWEIYPFSYADEPSGEPAIASRGTHPSIIEALHQADDRLRAWGWIFEEGVSPTPSEP